MTASYILLDTNVLSDARKERPPPRVEQFVLNLKPGTVAITTTSVFELHRGAIIILPQHPELALQYSQWLEDLLQSDVYLIPSNARVMQLVASMSMCPPLKDFWITQPKSKKMKFGSDPINAAISIIHQIPIATSDIQDFLRIHKHFPLPGLYDPTNDCWHVDPPIGWRLDPAANDEPGDTQWQDLFLKHN